jgi:uncharacterized protein with GYD domain
MRAYSTIAAAANQAARRIVRTGRGARRSLTLPRGVGSMLKPISPFRPEKEVSMAYFLEQVAYSTEGWQALVRSPQNRIEAVRPAIERLGGKIETAWYAFGEYDVVLIVQMPDNVSAAAIAMAFAAGGSCKAVKTTPLITIAEAVEAMKKASTSGYRAATAGG